MKTFTRRGIVYPCSDRNRSYVTDYQIKEEFPHFYKKIKEVLTSGDYNKTSKEIIESIANVLMNDGSISWKQFDLVIKTRTCIALTGYTNLNNIPQYRNRTQAANMISRDFYTESVFRSIINNCQNAFNYQFGMDDDYEALGGWLDKEVSFP